jgi:hypothetical protein
VFGGIMFFKHIEGPWSHGEAEIVFSQFFIFILKLN